MKSSLVAILLSSAALAQVLGRFTSQPIAEWVGVTLENPPNWVASRDLEKKQFDVSSLPYDEFTADDWSYLILDWCRENPSAKTALVYSDVISENGRQVRNWFGYCYGDVASASDFTRKDGVDDSVVYILV